MTPVDRHRSLELCFANLVHQLPRVGPYQLLCPLGAGGMAETFVAVRRGPAGFEQRVCLKRILPDHAQKEAFVELFLDEARLLSQLRCGSIVQVHDFGEADGSFYMALELVDGADLQTILATTTEAKKPLRAPVVLHVISQLLGALDYAHSAEANGQPLCIVHRDVSPSNVLVSKHGEIKLTDFGIAKFSSRRHQTRSGFTKGKVAYMSPEQVRGEAVDGRSDLFATGVVAYELLTNQHPFHAGTDLEVLQNILSGTRRPLRVVAPELPSYVTDFVEALLATQADARPKTAAEALSLLPAIEKPFERQRELAAIVQECCAGDWLPTPDDAVPDVASDTIASAPTVQAAASPAAAPSERPVAPKSQSGSTRILDAITRLWRSR